MHAMRIARAAARAEDLGGRVLCRELRAADGRVALAKGRLLDHDDATVALSLEWTELHVLALDEGDVHEDDAGTRVAQASAGVGVEVGPSSGGHWPLVAAHRGVLSVAIAALERVNTLDGPCVYTVYDGQVVEKGETVARAKIIPFAVPEAVLSEVEALAGDGGLVGVRPFVPHQVGAVVH